MAQDSVAEIKNRLTITDVVAPYVKLRKAGRSDVGLCPFHKEKTGSFHVSVDRGTWHCFGCGEGGDMFTFVEKIEGVDFKGALKLLADKAGVELVYDPAAKERSSRTDRLREAMSRAQLWYASQLPGTDALAYAKKRGITEDSIKEWGIGFAPDGWRGLLESLSAQGFSVEELAAAGLVKEADGKPGTYYDRFRNRLVFPIRDSAGRVVAFTGRDLEAPSSKHQAPNNVQTAKYLNSPETELYHKSDILYGLDRAKDAIRMRQFVMLVEGQMDVIHCHQAGFQNAVALSGTALTARHLSLMKRYSENLMLVLDADQAGLNATMKSAQLALQEGLKVKAAKLVSGKDPADLITEDPKKFAECVKSAKPVVEFFLATLTEREKDPHRLVSLAERVVLPLIRAVGSPMEREHFMQSTARVLGLSVDAVRESLVKVRHSQEEPVANVRHSQTGPEARKSAREARREMLLGVIQAYPDTALAKRVAAEYSRITGVRELPSDALPESVAFHAEETYGEKPSEDAADELLHAFEEAVIREAYQEAVRNLREAEAQGDASAVTGAQERCTDLMNRLAKLGS